MISDEPTWIVEPNEDASKPPRMMRVGRGLKNMDRDFDIAYWQAQDTTARMNAAWELVEHYLRQHGRADELELQRTVTKLQRGRS